MSNYLHIPARLNQRAQGNRYRPIWESRGTSQPDSRRRGILGRILLLRRLPLLLLRVRLPLLLPLLGRLLLLLLLLLLLRRRYRRRLSTPPASTLPSPLLGPPFPRPLPRPNLELLSEPSPASKSGIILLYTHATDR